MSEEKPKISLTSKISLSGSGINKEDILKKFINNSGSPVVHKNIEVKESVTEEKHEDISSPYDVPEMDFIQDSDINAYTNTPPSSERIKKLNARKEQINIKIPSRVEIKPTIQPTKTKNNIPQEDKSLSIFGNRKEEQAGIVIEVNEDEEAQKEDRRDKSLIEKHLRHYRYLEFDNEEEISKLHSGEKLREILSQQREKAEEEEIEVVSSFSSEDRNRRKRNSHSYERKQKTNKTVINAVREIEIPDLISLTELANRLSIKVKVVIAKAKYIGEIIDEDDILDRDIAELIVEEFGHKVLRVKEKTPEDVLSRKALHTDIQTVPPVVTVMGHVDHGKTSLLDALRQTDIAGDEAGGITQAIGAYQVTLEDGKKITFIDTPGHEAFTAMRARGANATDIVILVVAADDSINTQTIEAIHHAKAAKCPIIVAVNKMDLPEANLQKVKEDLLTHDLIPEDFGGDISVLPVSALKKTGLKELEEQILLNAEVLDLKANFLGHAGGVVLESKLDNQKGVSVTLLVKHGILKNGNIILAGQTFGRVRKILNDKAETLTEALPSMPVEVYGFNEVPQAGERFFILESEKSAREVISHRIQRIKEEEAELQQSEDPFTALLRKEKKEVNAIIRCDMQGSVDAIKYSLSKITHEDIALNIVHILVGNVTEADVLLAKTNNATIFAFNVSVNSGEEALARKNNIPVREHSIIYKMIDEIKALLSKHLEPVTVETHIGTALVRQVFDISKSGKIAGCMVQNGVTKRGSLAKVMRGEELVAKGNVRTLKHFQEDVKSIQQGKECGIQIEKFEDFQSGDIIEIYDITYEENSIK